MKKKSISLVIILFLVCLLSYYFYFNDRFDTVVEGRIYRSAQLSSDKLEKVIKERGIKTIINLRGIWDGADWYEREKEIAEKNSAWLYSIRLSPLGLPEIGKLISILDILLKAEKPILIHCYRGADRTGLVSAIALAIEQDPPLDMLKDHFSLRYGVLPFYGSTGPHFFKTYEEWLKKTEKKHNKNNLLYWIANEYVDNKGNLKYWLDSIDDKALDSDKSLLIKNGRERLSLKGWAFDFRTKSRVDALYIVIDNQLSSRVTFKYNRPDVAKFFKLGKKYYRSFIVGWEAEFKRDNISNGCHKISLKLVKNRSDVWDIPTDYEFCLNE